MEAIWSCQEGVEVPMPMRVFAVPFGKIASVKEPVEVANLVSGAPAPPEFWSVPHPNFPLAHVNFPVVASQVEMSAPKKLVVLAFVVKKLVVVALVPVAVLNKVPPVIKRLDMVVDETLKSAGMERVVVLLAERSCAPAEEVI